VTTVLATTLTTTLVNVAVGVFQGLMGHLFKPTDYQDVIKFY
jgi:multidrug efflux pump subunit AcrB